MSMHQVPYPASLPATDQAVLSLALTEEGAASVVGVRGPLDMDTVDLLVDFTKTVLAGLPPPVLVLDLSGVSFFGAAGITALLTVRQRAAARGCALVIRKPSRITLTILNLVGLREEFITE
ncbi:STAS domain-containing protein [Micromonospora azadirachtae]|uniref:STAS domain-containing protein n=1 Tax=Micromonospora azadirachtae TaxID=1970735 RepID=A0ABW2ZVG8_9ACTN